MAKGLIRQAIGTLLALLVCGALLVIGRYYIGFKSFLQGFNTPHSLSLTPPEPVIETHISVDQIRELKQLVTAKYYGEVVVEKKKKKARDFIGTKEGIMVLAVKATVLYGIDFSSMKDSDLVLGEDRSVKVYLPGVYELGRKLEDCRTAYSQHSEIFSTEEHDNLVDEAKIKVSKMALDNGIIDKAWDQGVSVIKNFFIALGFDEEKITVLHVTAKNK